MSIADYACSASDSARFLFACKSLLMPLPFASMPPSSKSALPSPSNLRSTNATRQLQQMAATHWIAIHNHEQRDMRVCAGPHAQ